MNLLGHLPQTNIHNLGDVLRGHTQGQEWHLLRCRASQDGRLADWLESRFSFYRALGVHRHGKTGLMSTQSLFPGYIFLLLKGNGIPGSPVACHVDPIVDQEEFSKQLAAIDAESRVKSGKEMGSALSPGDAVEIVSGSCWGFSGILDRIDKTTAIVEVEMMGSRVLIQVYPWNLERSYV